MSVIIKTSEMQYKDNNGVYHGVNAIAEKKIADQIEALDAAIDAQETRISTNISQMQSAADEIESQRQTMIAAIASVAGQGTDTTLTQQGVAADAKAVGDNISELKTELDTVNGGHIVSVTTTISGKDVAGLTASYEDGKLKIYGTSTATIRYLCLNGQNTVASTSTEFSQTLPPGYYRVGINITGSTASTERTLVYTATTFNTPIGSLHDGDTFKTSVPVMVALFVPKSANYGTSENPTYLEINIEQYTEKADKIDFDTLANSNLNLYFRRVLTEEDDLDDLTQSGWYFHTALHVPAHAPRSGQAYKYLVLVDSMQRSIQIAFSSYVIPSVFYRSRTTDNWGDWYYVPKVDTRVLPKLSDIQAQFTNGVLAAGTYTFVGYTSEDSPILLKMQSMYTETSGSGAPTIRFESRASNGTRLYYSHTYSIESDKEYKQQSWRIPNNFITDYVNIIITVPEGSTLAVKSFDCKYDPYVQVGDPQIIFHAHRGLEKFWPSETYNSVLAAAEMGFKSCIVIPKFTSDGVAVCFHNDGGSSSPLKEYLKMPNGSEVEALQDTSKKISDFTYAELMQWSMGVVKAGSYADEKILKMDDFLRICAETGMRPIFSIHPTLSADQWAALKVLIDKYNLASKLSVKDGTTDTWTRVINAFGDGGIYSIICLSSSVIDMVSKINSWKTAQGVTKTRVDAEWMNFDPTDATYVTRTQEAKAAGLIVSAVLRNESTGDYIKSCISNGITEFTNCRHCSMGLNW